ncbi:hypothetical protein [Spirosoma oryzicola]|uniref:hypothetical protein n=1 Tax=Spirosoma oryzicola TaxID=2898794 RepID=UPI001E41BD70|nr:hypothetical protein [Spirosoma oryzicola]UHG94745.1 hypothetical protein LQ777_28810 [Spirosoma oryzicola]
MKLLCCLTVMLVGYIVPALGQCRVVKDAYGQVTTTCPVNDNASESPSLNREVTFLGSEFMSFPLWQAGQIRVDTSGQALPCRLAYNLYSQEVICRFEDDLTPKSVTPISFVVNGVEYTRQLTNNLGLTYRFYTTPLSRGQTKLLRSTKVRLIKTPIRNGYDRDHPFAGYYQVDQQYYIQKGNAKLQPISLTKNSLLRVLGDQPELVKLAKQSLTVDQVIQLVSTYDSLRVLAQLQSTSLSTDPAFNEQVGSAIKYPVQAWQAQVYARVYVGFEITNAGQLTNIQLLSPENVGFGFTQAVEKALNQLSTTKSAYQGRYALPVAFTYSYVPNKELKFMPVTMLSEAYLAGRTLLNEFVVNQIIGKDKANSREVWGYYK